MASTYVVVCHNVDSGAAVVVVQKGGVQNGRAATEGLYLGRPSAPLLVTVYCFIVVVHAVLHRVDEFGRTAYSGQGGQGCFHLRQQNVMVMDRSGHNIHHSDRISRWHYSYTRITGLYSSRNVHIFTSRGRYIPVRDVINPYHKRDNIHVTLVIYSHHMGPRIQSNAMLNLMTNWFIDSYLASTKPFLESMSTYRQSSFAGTHWTFFQ